MRPEQRERLCDLVKDRDISHDAFISDTEKFLDLVALPISVEHWFAIKGDIEPLFNRLSKAISAVMDDYGATSALTCGIAAEGYGSGPQVLQCIQDALQEDYPKTSAALNGEELVDEAASIFRTHGLPLAYDSSSLFVEFLAFMIEVSEFEYDPRQLASDFVPGL